jgi:hypothetical protein
MAYELIQEVHTCRGEWKTALDRPFDAEKLADIKERYDRALRANAIYTRICHEQHAAWLADLAAAQDAVRAELAPLSKRVLCERYGLDPASWTKEQIIEDRQRRAIDTIEGEHARVKRIWAAMSPTEREAA